MRYCILKAIQDATIDETNVELKVTCGRKVVTLKSSDEEACNLRIEVAIQCDEGEPMVKESEVEHTVIVDPGCGDQVRRSKRKTDSVVQKDTPGLVNRNQTCYGICVLHTFAYLTQFFPVLREHYILQQLSFMKCNGQDKVSHILSQSITDYIKSLMTEKATGTNWRINQKKAQDSSEFLVYLLEDIDCNSALIWARPFAFETVCTRLYECDRNKGGCGHLQSAPIENMSTLYNFMPLLELATMEPDDDEIDVSMLIKRELRSREDITLSDHLRKCSECVETNSINPANSLICIHNYNPCEVCRKQFETQQREQRFKIAPKLLIVSISRNEVNTRKGRLQHCVKINSHVTLNMIEGNEETYQIVAITCHEGSGQGDGHYITYIRSEGQWRLFNDSEVTDVPDIDTTVCGRDVAMCYYVPTDSRVEILENSMIGTNERRIEPNISMRTRNRMNKRLKQS